MKTITAVISKAGGRSINEDYFTYTQQDGRSCWAVADGLGGHEGGEIASKVVTGAVIERFQAFQVVSMEVLKECMLYAQSTLLKEQKAGYASMRTTGVVMMTDHVNTVWGYAGDSRFYYIKEKKIAFRTKDHSVPQVLVNIGEISAEQIRFHEDRNKLLKVFGNQKEFKPSLGALDGPLHPGDAFLLCTDGFWEYITEEEMLSALYGSQSPEEWLQKMECILLKQQAGHEEPDNYTAVAVLIGE